MPTIARALIVAPGAARVVPLAVDDPGPLQRIVGGFFSVIVPAAGPCASRLAVAHWHAYVNWEAADRGEYFNVLATILARAAGWASRGSVLHGTVVFLGDNGEGNEGDVPDGLAELGRDIGLWDVVGDRARSNRPAQQPDQQPRGFAAWPTADVRHNDN